MRQRVIIFILIGIMVMSAFGTGLLLLLGDDSKNSDADRQAAEQFAGCVPGAVDGEGAAPKTPDTFKPSGDVKELGITDLKEGSGDAVQAGECVVVWYHGTTAGGKVFDSAYESGTPLRIGLDQVIPGWQLGIPGMKPGGIRRLVIPSDLAYGEIGSPPVIGANEDLVFTVQLIRTER